MDPTFCSCGKPAVYICKCREFNYLCLFDAQQHFRKSHDWFLIETPIESRKNELLEVLAKSCDACKDMKIKVIAETKQVISQAGESLNKILMELGNVEDFYRKVLKHLICRDTLIYGELTEGIIKAINMNEPVDGIKARFDNICEFNKGQECFECNELKLKVKALRKEIDVYKLKINMPAEPNPANNQLILNNLPHMQPEPAHEVNKFEREVNRINNQVKRFVKKLRF